MSEVHGMPVVARYLPIFTENDIANFANDFGKIGA